jgi:hypothetical protein
MNREQKVASLLARGPDDERSLALNEVDATARLERTWGTQAHRNDRQKIEASYEAAKRRLESLGDEQLDRELAAGSQP